MKNKLYYLGIATSSLLIIGSLFKIMHWAGANIILTVSTASLILVFFPLAFINCYRANGKKKTALFIAAFSTLFFIFLSAAFKVMHWEGASILIFIGILFPIVVFLPVYLYFHFKEEEESLTNFLYMIFFLVGLSGMSGFLAIDVSKDLLTDITRVQEISDLSEYYNLKIEQNKDQNTDELAESISQQANDLIDQIEGLKEDLTIGTDEVNREAIIADHTIETWKIRNLYGRDAGPEILVARGRGYLLDEALKGYYAYLTSIPEIKENESDYISQLPGITSMEYQEGNDMSWNITDVNDPLMLNLLRLTAVENVIRLATLEALYFLDEKTPGKKNNTTANT